MTATAPRSDIEIRRATRADLLEVLRIENQAFGQPWPYAAFEQFLGAPGFLVAEDGIVVGYVIADTIAGPGMLVGHIKDLAVRTKRQREGVGRTLLARGITTLASAGAGRVKLEVRRSNRAARSLYESFGFENHHIRAGYYDDGEDAYVMIRQL